MGSSKVLLRVYWDSSNICIWFNQNVYDARGQKYFKVKTVWKSMNIYSLSSSYTPHAIFPHVTLVLGPGKSSDSRRGLAYRSVKSSFQSPWIHPRVFLTFLSTLAGCLEGLVKIFNNVLRALQSDTQLAKPFLIHMLNLHVPHRTFFLTHPDQIVGDAVSNALAFLNKFTNWW